VNVGTSEGDMEALRAERDALQEKVEKLDNRVEKRHRARKITAAILAALTIITFTLGVPGLWARRTFFNTDRWVATVSPLASDPAVQQYIATELTNEIFTALDVQTKVSNALSQIPKIGTQISTILSGPITSSAEGFVQDQVLKLVQSQGFQEFWVQAQTLIHNQVVAVLQGKSSQTVSTAGGVVSLNLIPLINEALQAIQSSAQSLIGASVTLPTISVNEVPSQAIAKLNAALGTNLPSNFGNIVIYRSSTLAAIQSGVYWFNWSLIGLAVAWVIFFASGLLASTRRRRTLLQMSVGMAVGLVIIRRLAIYFSGQLVAKVPQTGRAAANAVSDQLMHSLLQYTGWLLALWLVVTAVGLITGPYPWAAKLRSLVVAAVLGLGHLVRAAFTSDVPSQEWIAPRRDWLLAVIAGVTLVLLWWFSLSGWWMLIVLVVAALLGFSVWRAGRERHPVEA
jgi:hypothetical protein